MPHVTRISFTLSIGRSIRMSTSCSGRPSTGLDAILYASNEMGLISLAKYSQGSIGYSSHSFIESKYMGYTVLRDISIQRAQILVGMACGSFRYGLHLPSP